LHDDWGLGFILEEVVWFVFERRVLMRSFALTHELQMPRYWTTKVSVGRKLVTWSLWANAWRAMAALQKIVKGLVEAGRLHFGETLRF